MEWDRPDEGLYEPGEIRLITSRGANGTIGSCRKATDAEALQIVHIEALHALTNHVGMLLAFMRGEK
jgi:hypothetical protein